MASITIRNLEDEVKRRLRIQAATKGHSMEEEARRILRVALGTQVDAPDADTSPNVNFSVVESLGDSDLDLPLSEPVRDPPIFD